MNIIHFLSIRYQFNLSKEKIMLFFLIQNSKYFILINSEISFKDLIGEVSKASFKFFDDSLLKLFNLLQEIHQEENFKN